MKKFTKLFLTFALLFGVMGGVNSVKAAKVDWSPSGWVATWNGETNTMSWKGSDGYKVMKTGLPTGDISAYGKIHYNINSITGDNNYIQLKVVSTGKSDQTIDLTVGENDINFSDYTSVINFTDVTELTLWGTGSSDGTAIITDFYMESSTRTLNVDLSIMAASNGEAMWDKDTHTFSWKQKWSNSIALPGLTGNLSAYTAINFVTAAGNCDHFRIIVYLEGGVQKIWSGDVGTKSVTFSSLELTEEDLTAVSSINISGAGDGEPTAENPLSIIVTSISLEGPALNYIKASTVYTRPAGSTSDLEDLTGNYPSWQKWPDTFKYLTELGSTTVFCGNGDGSNESNHVTITGSDYICFDVIEATGDGQPLRVWIWDGEKVQTLYAYPIANYSTANYSIAANVSSVGTYVTKVTGCDYLKGIKTNYGGGTIKISKAYTCSGTPIAYVPTGTYKLFGESTGSASLTAALADANAIYYDATGVSGTGVTLDAANPNALFKANTGVLANTKNVIVGSTCANLELEDGKPFKTSAAFTATNAKFTKTVGDAGYATMVIPFAAALPAGVDAYNLTGVSCEIITHTDAASLTADQPVMIKAAAGDYEFTATGASIAATADGLVTNGLLKGTYANTTAAADGNNYVLQNSATYGVNFYQVTGTIANIKPFRAYLTAPAGGARLFFDFESTGITNANVEAPANNRYYNLQGVEVAQPTKGLYIVNGKKVVLK